MTRLTAFHGRTLGRELPPLREKKSIQCDRVIFPGRVL